MNIYVSMPSKRLELTFLPTFKHMLLLRQAKDYSILVPRRKKKDVIPPYYTKEERKLLEETRNEKSVCGKRDHAIILLINRLGLRSSDICQLTLEQFDFEHKYFSFYQVKTEKPVILPILEDVLFALRDYIENERPQVNSNYLFVEAYAPHTPITRVAIYDIYNKYISMSGINVGNRKHGAHAFRASIASSMINNGLSYETVKQVRLIKKVGRTGLLPHWAELPG